MEQNTVVIPTNNVEGNITSCKLENQLIAIQRNSIFSFRELNTYATYNVCTKQIVKEYTIPNWSDFGTICFFVIVIFLFFWGRLKWVSSH